MDDYKATLNLPTTAFPMKANLAENEQRWLGYWADKRLYQQLQARWAGKPKFILHDGPPYANGNIHIGHAVNKVLKDIVCKSRSFAGYATPYVPGWDCHGLPIELNVEKKLGKAGGKVSYAEFRRACRAYAEQFINIQKEEFKRLGLLGDWENPYITMDYSYEANIVRALGKVIANGYVSQGFKPVHWCIDCGSALAQAEVEYQDKTSPAIDVRFRVSDNAELARRLNINITEAVSIPIWTTTPWTLPANEAVALHPESEYVFIATAQNNLIIMRALLEKVMARYGETDYQIRASFSGNILAGLQLQHPLFADKTVPVLCGEHVTAEEGTGAVHTAPAHGPDDFALAKQHGISIHNPVGNDGCYTKDTPLFAGMHVFKVNQHILDILQRDENLIHQAALQHSYPHCWRHKSPLIFRTTPQWFITMDETGLRKLALNAISHVNWIPERGEARLSAMVNNNPDWCISRQRSWGVPIPVFLRKTDNTPHPDTPRLINLVAERIERTGIEAWHELDIKELLGDEADDYVKGKDVLDVWFDSGVTHECVLQQREALAYPADLYLEGTDQHRGWFQSSLLCALAINQTAPYKAVLTHGFTVDAEGRKMSKSIGNVVAPEKVVQTLGADILRLWIASTDYRNEMAVSDEILKRTADTYRRLRNTARFLLANLHDFLPAEHALPSEQLLSLDRYIVAKALDLQNEIITAYDKYQFNQVYQRVHHFCAIDLGGFYLDVIKDRQYTLPANHPARRSAQTALYHIVQALVCWLAPILSFTAEEIYQHIPGVRADSVFLQNWYAHLTPLPEKTSMNAVFWEQVIAVRDVVNKELETLRAAGAVGAALEAEVNLYCDEMLLTQLKQLEDELRFVLITSSAQLHPLASAPGTAKETIIAGLKVLVAPSAQQKCVRCWHRVADVGSKAAHPELCGRCVKNVDTEGESRRYA